MNDFNLRKELLVNQYKEITDRKNIVDDQFVNGIFERYKNPILTADHVPLNWRFDFNPRTNPYLLERLMVNSVFNSGAIEIGGKILLVNRIEGADRKSFFAIAESETGIDGFRFWDSPMRIPEIDPPDVSIYDMRLVAHEDGWIYGTFCSDRKDPRVVDMELYKPFASAAIARTKDLINWERLPNLITSTAQQRNAIIHPEFIDGKYGFYLRPQDDFMEVGKSQGIVWGECDNIENPVVIDKHLIDKREFSTIKSLKNGPGAPPLKTDIGWIHIAHAVRNTACGMRYVLYVFVCDLEKPWKVIHRPGGYLIAPEGMERVGDVSNVLFSAGSVLKSDGTIFIYYASSDTRMHVAKTNINRLMDYAINTPEDPLLTAKCVEQRIFLIEKNRYFWKSE